MANPKNAGILKLLDSHQKLVAMVHATWCPHCTQLLPTWQQIMEEHPNANVYDIEQKEFNGALGARIGNVSGFPTILSIDEAGNRNEYSGSRNKEAITNWIMSELNKSKGKSKGKGKKKSPPKRKVSKTPSRGTLSKKQKGGYKYPNASSSNRPSGRRSLGRRKTARRTSANRSANARKKKS